MINKKHNSLSQIMKWNEIQKWSPKGKNSWKEFPSRQPFLSTCLQIDSNYSKYIKYHCQSFGNQFKASSGSYMFIFFNLIIFNKLLHGFLLNRIVVTGYTYRLSLAHPIYISHSPWANMGTFGTSVGSHLVNMGNENQT